jgi:hypothetical protein
MHRVKFVVIVVLVVSFAIVHDTVRYIFRRIF